MVSQQMTEFFINGAPNLILNNDINIKHIPFKINTPNGSFVIKEFSFIEVRDILINLKTKTVETVMVS